MNVLEIRHEFFDVETRNSEQLYQAFCNYVYLGQWELCRTCLQILFPKRSQLQTNLEELLIDIISNPTAYCTGSKAVPTPLHFSLLLVEECRTKQYLELKLIETLKYGLMFKFFLAVGDIQPTRQVVQDFDRVRQYADSSDIPATLLTDSMADFLIDLWLHEIPRVYSLTRFYIYSSMPSTHSWLLQIHKRALDLRLQQLKNLNNEQQKQSLIDLLLSLHIYSCDHAEFRKMTRDTLKKIVIYAVEATNNHGQLFNLKTLYRSVLNNNDLATLISELESEYRSELLKNEPVVIHFLKKNSFKIENFFWKELYLYLIENKLDLISCVLNDSVVMIQNRDYLSFDQLLNIQELTPLHLYIFLVIWPHIKSINDANVLNDTLNTKGNKTDLFVKCLSLFQSHIKFVTWLCTVRRFRDGSPPLPNVSDLLTLLHTNSPLSLMYRYLDMPTIDSGEILEKLQTTEVDIDHDSEKQPRDKPRRVRFHDTPTNTTELLSSPQRTAPMIYLGYLSINSVIQRILSSNNDNDVDQTSNDLFAATRNYLVEIFPLRFRLDLLENMFSLIFIQQSELKADEPAEVFEQSINARSNSISPSEQLFSSLQSNLTNDSLHTSTQALSNVKTQASLRRIDTDLLDNSDDNASICSSSVSSVGSFYHNSMYRSGLLIDPDVLHKLLLFIRDQISEVRTLYQKINEKATDRDTIETEKTLDKCFQGYSTSDSEKFIGRVTKLNNVVSEALWRHQLFVNTASESSTQQTTNDGEEQNDSLHDNSIIKNLIIPTPTPRHSHRRKRRSRLSESSTSSATVSATKHRPKVTSALVSHILSTRDNLLAICLKEGKVTEANDVIRLCNMQDHTLAVEAKFSKLFRDTIAQLCAASPMSIPSTDKSSSNSALAGLANFATSALDHSSVQNQIAPLLEAARSKSVAATLPTSNYFDREHFVSLTLFDLAINAPTMTISKTLLDTAQHNLPLPRPLYSSNSSIKIKSLNDMINSYSQLTNTLNSSFYDLLLDVTIPLDGTKATKVIHFYKRIYEHCSQYYLNQQNAVPIEQQVKMTGDFFENDPHAKFDLINYIRNVPNQSKTSSTSDVNYFLTFYAYLQNFRLLMNKFPLPDISTDTDLCKYAPLSIIHRIVSRPGEIDLGQLQLMASKLNIDISLVVTLNIIRPLFIDKTITTSCVHTNRRATLLQHQPITLFLFSEPYRSHQLSRSLSSANNKKQTRRAIPLLKRYPSKVDDNSHEPQTSKEHPENFIRILLTKLLDIIKKVIQTSGHNHMTIEHIDRVLQLDSYDEIMISLSYLNNIDLNLLQTNDERICFFANLYNFLIIVSHFELVRTKLTQITSTAIFRNELERLLFLLTTRINLGQLKQISLYDIRYYILKQNILVDGLQLVLDPTGPFYQYAPIMNDYQQFKVGLILNDCISSSAPFVVFIPEFLNEQLQRSTRDFVEKCVIIKTNEVDRSLQITLSHMLYNQFDQTQDNLTKFIADHSSNDDILYAISEKRTIKTEVVLPQYDFAICFDHRLCSSPFMQHEDAARRQRRNSLPSSTSIEKLTTSVDFLPPTSLPSHLIDFRTISFVQEKSPALGQILQIYVQSIVHNKPIESDNSPLKNYFSSLLLSPALSESAVSIGDEWFRSIVLNDVTHQYDLLLYLCSILWERSKYVEIVDLLDSLLPSFVVHSPYFQILRDVALLTLIKRTSEPERAFNYLRKIHDCHLLIHATLTYLPRFDGPTCLQLLDLCLTSCKKTHQDYVPWIQERVNTMYVYKTLCLGALAQFNKCMERISKYDDQLNVSIDDMATKKTSSKCLTWQHAQEHSKRDPLAVVDMFIFEEQFDMGHKWLGLLINHVDDHIINRVRMKLIEEHIQWLLKQENMGHSNKILYIINTITNTDDKWHLCIELLEELSKPSSGTQKKTIPFSRLFIKFRVVQYMLAHFEHNEKYFQEPYNRSNLCILATGLALFFNCIPIEQTDSYQQIVGQPLLIFEQLLMNGSIDVAKASIETLKILIKKYSLEDYINIARVDQLIEIYTKKSVQLNVVLRNEETTNVDTKSSASVTPPSQPEARRPSALPPNQVNQNKTTPETSLLGRRNNSAGANNLFNSIRQRISSKPLNTSPTAPEVDTSYSSSTLSSSHVSNTPTTGSIPIKSPQQPQQPTPSSFIDYLSASFSSRPTLTETPHPPTKGAQQPEFVLPATIPSKESWVLDDDVTICMCCKQSQFSMFNRRHHCRRCGRVVCKVCSQHMTVIKSRLERTCKDCYQSLQNNPAPTASTRQEPNTSTKKLDHFRPLSKTTAPFKRQPISQIYLAHNRKPGSKSNNLLLGTSLVDDTPSILEESQLLLSSSFSTSETVTRKSKSIRQPLQDSAQNKDQDLDDNLELPIIYDQVNYQLTGTFSDDALRNDFHYDQSPSISLCLSLIELHSDQYQCGKLLIKLCEYLSEQLSATERNTEIDYGLVLNIIKNLLFTAKMKLMSSSSITEEQLKEQQRLIESCERYNNLVDILNRLNMANCSLPVLNDLLQPDTLRKIRNKLLDEERYQLAMDISTRCNLDTQSIWFQWGMAYLRIGQYAEAREKFEKCLQKHTETSDALAKQQQRTHLSQDKLLNDIILYFESSHPLKYSMKYQYLAEQRTRQTGQARTNLKYLNSLSAMPRVSNQSDKVIQDEILFYLTTYSDDAHLLDYYLRHEYYKQAFELKCSLTVFRDHIYMPLLKRNHIKHLFNYISSHNSNANALMHHLKYMCTYLKEQEMYHSLQQLQLFLNDTLNVALTSVKLFTANRTTYIDLFEKRMSYLQDALDFFQQVKVDTEQIRTKIQSTKRRIELQIEMTRYIHAQLKRLNTDGSNLLVNCPTLFDGKDSIIRLALGVRAVSDNISNAFSFINKIIICTNIPPMEILIPCAEQIGKSREYRTLQQMLQLLREYAYNDNALHDDIIGACIRQSGADVEQSRDQDTLIQMIKSEDTRIDVCIAIGKLRAAYLTAIRFGKEDKVREIRDDALKNNQMSIYDICKRWLENQASGQ